MTSSMTSSCIVSRHLRHIRVLSYIVSSQSWDAIGLGQWEDQNLHW
jgi:hypothetical protein